MAAAGYLVVPVFAALLLMGCMRDPSAFACLHLSSLMSTSGAFPPVQLCTKGGSFSVLQAVKTATSREDCVVVSPVCSMFHIPAMQVRDPRVEVHSPPSDDSDASLVWDCRGTVYGRMAKAAARGVDGIAQQMASCSKLRGRQLALQFVAVPDDVHRIRAASEVLPDAACGQLAMPEGLCDIHI